PVEALRLRSLGEARPGDQHEVGVLRQPLEPRAPDLAELALDPVPDHGAADLPRDRDSEPRLLALLAGERVQHEEARRHGSTLPIDRVEVPGARETVAPLHG